MPFHENLLHLYKQWSSLLVNLLHELELPLGLLLKF
jgi:hypothetical protein